MTSGMMSLKELVIALFDTGDVIRFGSFRLKIHEKYPDAPESPFYVSLRTKDNKDGKLTDALVFQIAYQLADLMDREYPAALPSYICGLPKVGEPFVNAIEEMRGIPTLELVKQKYPDGTREILPPPESEWPEVSGVQEVAIVDDLITRAGSKIEGIDAIRKMDFVIRHCFVFLDRGNGAASHLLEQRQVELHAVINDNRLFDILVEAGKIDPEMRERCLDYRDNLDAYILDARRSLDPSLGDSESD